MYYILISDIDYRKTFDVISILKSKGYKGKLLLGSNSMTMLSRLKYYMLYGNERVVLLRSFDRDLFFNDLRKISSEYVSNEIIYLPVEEQPTSYYIDFVEKYGHFNFLDCLPDSSVYNIFRNKRLLNDYCLSHAFPAPRRYSFNNIPSIVYPIILKPCIGSGSIGITRINDAAEFSKFISQKNLSVDYLIQELIPNGKEVQGGFFLCKGWMDLPAGRKGKGIFHG